MTAIRSLGPLVVRLDQYNSEILPTTDEPLPGQRDVEVPTFGQYLSGLAIGENSQTSATWYRERDALWKMSVEDYELMIGALPREDPPHVQYIDDIYAIPNPYHAKYMEALLQAHPEVLTRTPLTAENYGPWLYVAEEMTKGPGPYSWDQERAHLDLRRALNLGDVAALQQLLMTEELDESRIRDVLEYYPEAIAQLPREEQKRLLADQDVGEMLRLNVNMPPRVVRALTALVPGGEDIAYRTATKYGVRDRIHDGLLQGRPLTLPGKLDPHQAAELVEEFELKVQPDLLKRYGLVDGYTYRVMRAHGADATYGEEVAFALPGAEAVIGEATEEDLALLLPLTANHDNPRLAQLIINALPNDFVPDDWTIANALQYGSSAYVELLWAFWAQEMEEMLTGNTDIVPSKDVVAFLADRTDIDEGLQWWLAQEIASRGWIDVMERLLTHFGPDDDGWDELINIAYSNGQSAFARRFQPTGFRLGDSSRIVAERPRTTVQLIMSAIMPEQLSAAQVARLSNNMDGALALASWPILGSFLRGYDSRPAMNILQPITRALTVVLPKDLVGYLAQAY